MSQPPFQRRKKLFFGPFFKFLNLFGSHYKIRVGLLFISSVIAGLMEIIGVMLVLPFMIVLRSPEAGLSMPILKDVYHIFNFTQPNQLIYVLAFVLGLTFAVKNLYMIAQRYLEFGFIMRWKNNTRQALMKHYLSLPYILHLKRNSTSIINTIINEIDFVFQNSVLQYVVLFSNIVILFMLLAMILAFFFIPSLIAGAILLVLMVVQMRLVRSYSNQIKDEFTKNQENSLEIIRRSFLAIKETKTFLKEESFIKLFAENNKRNSHQERMNSFMMYMPPHLTEIILISSIMILSCLILSYEGAASKAMQHLAILALAAFRIAPVINRILFCYGQIQSSQVVLKKIHNEIAQISHEDEPFTKAAKLPFNNAITLRDVSFSYKDEKHTSLKKINLNIEKGSFLGIIGPSGSGKTTLADIILGLHQPTEGKVYLDDLEITQPIIRGYRANISYVSQHPFISPGTVEQNIAFGVNEDEMDHEKIKAVLQQVELLDFFMAKPAQLKTTLGEDGKNLSGGQRQRIAIARALYFDTEILIMDEATSALDVETEEHISNVINKLSGEKTIISIAHRLSTLKRCDSIIYMEQGEILNKGDFATLYNTSEKIRRVIDLTNLHKDQLTHP